MNNRAAAYAEITKAAMPLRVREILHEVAEAHKQPVRIILSREQGRAASEARYAVWRRIRAEMRICGLPPSYPMIGRWFDRDHTSVIAGVKGGRKARLRADCLGAGGDAECARFVA